MVFVISKYRHFLGGGDIPRWWRNLSGIYLRDFLHIFEYIIPINIILWNVIQIIASFEFIRQIVSGMTSHACILQDMGVSAIQVKAIILNV